MSDPTAQFFCSGAAASQEEAISQRISTLLKTDDWVVVHRGHELYDAEDLDRLQAEEAE